MRYKPGVSHLFVVGWCLSSLIVPIAAAEEQALRVPNPKAVLKAAQKVVEGKQALIGRQTLEAYHLFQRAARFNPQNGEARLYLAVTRLLSWPIRNKPYFSQAGLKSPAGKALRPDDVDPLQFIALVPDVVLLPDALTMGDRAQNALRREFLGDLSASLEDVSQVPDGFGSTLPLNNPFTGMSGVELDDADVVLFQALLHLALAQLHLSQVYDTGNVRVEELRDQALAGTIDAQQDVQERYPDLLRLRHPEQAALAKQALIAAAERYLAGEALLEEETDAQDNDLIALSLSVEDMSTKKAFHQSVVNVKRSLEGLSEPGWTLTLDQMLNLGDFFDRPVDFRSLENGIGVQEALLTYIHHQTERALANLQKVPGGYSELVDWTDYGSRISGSVEVDEGDRLAVESAIESLHGAVSLLAGYNADIELVPLVQPAIERRLDVEDHLLTGHPQLLRVLSLTPLLKAKLSAQRALQRLLESSSYLRFSDDANQQDDLAPYQGSLARREMRWRPQLEQLDDLEGVVDDDPTDPASNLQVNFNRLIDNPSDPRNFLPSFDETRPLLEQLPDPTLDGLLPDTTSEDWLNKL